MSQTPVDLNALRAMVANREKAVREAKEELDALKGFLGEAERLFGPSAASPPSVRHPTRGPYFGLSTKDAIMKVLESSFNEEVSIDRLVELLRMGDWQTESAKPTDVVRTTISRLLKQGAPLARVRQGVYLLVVEATPPPGALSNADDTQQSVVEGSSVITLHRPGEDLLHEDEIYEGN